MIPVVNDSQNLAHKALVAERFAGLTCIVIGVATIIRPMLITLDPWFSYLGIANTLLGFFIYRVIASRKFDSYAPHLVLGVGIMGVLPLLLVSGGVNSQFSPLVSLFPFLGLLLDGRRAAIWVAVFWGLCVVLALTYAQFVPDLTDEVVHQGKTLSRAIWLLLALTLATYFACQFDRSFSLLQERLHRQASEDPLTGLANRRTLDEQMALALHRAQRQQSFLSLLVIDADHFKRLNDTRGHAAGDVCLVQLAQVLRSHTRQGQDLVARFGGEEFVVLLEGTDSDGAARVAEHIRAGVAALVLGPTSDPYPQLTVTIGVTTTYGGNLDQSVDQLLRAADAALYAGKANGRNRVELGDIDLPGLMPA